LNYLRWGKISNDHYVLIYGPGHDAKPDKEKLYKK